MGETELSYEQAMEKLEEILRRLDTGDLSLEESMEYFQKGLGYIQLCQKKLTDAEGTLQMLQEGKFSVVPESLFQGTDGSK